MSETYYMVDDFNAYWLTTDALRIENVQKTRHNEEMDKKSSQTCITAHPTPLPNPNSSLNNSLVKFK